MSDARAERSSVQWGKTRIAYTVLRSTRRGTVAVAVEPSGAVVLTAPTSTPIARLDRVVRDKALWIVERMRRRKDLAQPREREFVSGETVMSRGRTYRLRVVESTTPRQPRLQSGRLVVAVRPKLGPRHKRAAVRAAEIAWYRERAARVLPARAKVWMRKMGLDLSDIRITEPRKRWGSCSADGVLRLNWRVVQAPVRIIDYVIAHELTHIWVRHHGPKFWAALGRVMPDYERHRAALEKLGATLIW